MIDHTEFHETLKFIYELPFKMSKSYYIIESNIYFYLLFLCWVYFEFITQANKLKEIIFLDLECVNLLNFLESWYSHQLSINTIS